MCSCRTIPPLHYRYVSDPWDKATSRLGLTSGRVILTSKLLSLLYLASEGQQACYTHITSFTTLPLTALSCKQWAIPFNKGTPPPPMDDRAICLPWAKKKNGLTLVGQTVVYRKFTEIYKGVQRYPSVSISPGTDIEKSFIWGAPLKQKAAGTRGWDQTNTLVFTLAPEYALAFVNVSGWP